MLACVEPAEGQHFGALEQAVTAHASALSGCICVLLGWDPARQRLIRRLRGLGVPVLVLVLSDPGVGDTLPHGPMADVPHMLHRLEVGQVQEGLRRL